MFKTSFFTPSGVRIYTSVEQNIAGFDPADTDDPQIQDILRKYKMRGRELMSENSEDALSWSTFHALSGLADKEWLTALFSAAVNEQFAKKYAPHVGLAQIRFWVSHVPPGIYLQWLRNKVRQEGEAAIKHLDPCSASRIMASRRLQKIMQGDQSEVPERATEADIEIRLGKELIIFIEAKLFSDISVSGTFNPVRNQVVRNMEILEYTAQTEGFKDRRFILLTLDRKDKIYTQVMKRYRNSDMRMLREWDELGDWLAVKEDLPHHAAKPDSYFQEMTLKMGWLLWSDCWKILAHYSRRKK